MRIATRTLIRHAHASKYRQNGQEIFPHTVSLRTVYAWSAVLAALVSWSIMAHGVPALRHDWRMPALPAATGDWIAGFYRPWLTDGIGTAQPYPTFYWIGFALWPFHAILSAWEVVLIAVAGATFLAASSAARIARHALAPFPAVLAVSAVAALNPWVYSKYVAGHIFMVLAYALLLALLAELTRPQPRRWVILILAAASITQIEFFVLAVVPLVYWCVRQRTHRVLITLAVSALPILLGIAFYYHTLRQTPYALAWQRAGSVHLTDGLLMLGYEFHYANAFHAFWPALLALGALAAYGIFRAWRDPLAKVVACFGVGAVLFASGTSGILAVPYSWLVVHLPESGVFRELYDLIAIVAILYVFGLSHAFSAGRASRFAGVALAGAAVLAIPWIAAPVSGFGVPGQTIPAVSFPADPGHRVALFPAYQPLSLRGAGSGYDPDLYSQTGRAEPVNEFFPRFPVNEALGYAWYDRDFSALRALGVTSVVSRSYLTTNWDSLRYQQADVLDPATLPNDTPLKAPPILSVAAGTPELTSDPQDLLSNAVFFSDAPRFRTAIKPMRGGTAGLDIQHRWIDIRFADLTHPEWSTAFGGVVTSGTAPLAIPRGYAAVLAQVQGKLVDQRNNVVAPGSKRLRWWALPHGATSLTCVGTCAVIAMGNPPRSEPRTPAHWNTITYHPFAPWIISVHAQQTSDVQTLRFAEAYDRYWMALDAGHALQHFRLNSALNGWTIPAGSARTIIVFQGAALLQFSAECFAAVMLAFMLYVSLKRPQEQ